MTIGNHYKIIGIPACVQNGPQATACIEVSSVQPCKPNGKEVPFRIDLKFWKTFFFSVQILENFSLSRSLDCKTTVGPSSYSVKCAQSVSWERLFPTSLSMHWEWHNYLLQFFSFPFPTSLVTCKLLGSHTCNWPDILVSYSFLIPLVLGDRVCGLWSTKINSCQLFTFWISVECINILVLCKLLEWQFILMYLHCSTKCLLTSVLF